MKLYSAPLTKLNGNERLLQWRIKRRKSLRHHGMENVIHHRVVEIGKDSVKAGEFIVNRAEYLRLRGQRTGLTVSNFLRPVKANNNPVGKAA